VPQLTGALLDQGLVAALAVSDERWRAQALSSFMSVTPDGAQPVTQIRGAMIDHIFQNLSRQARCAVLEFCSDVTLFFPPILSPNTLASIASHIIDICRRWTWL
jgi:hypothetical protein